MSSLEAKSEWNTKYLFSSIRPFFVMSSCSSRRTNSISCVSLNLWNQICCSSFAVSLSLMKKRLLDVIVLLIFLDQDVCQRIKCFLKSSCIFCGILKSWATSFMLGFPVFYQLFATIYFHLNDAFEPYLLNTEHT